VARALSASELSPPAAPAAAPAILVVDDDKLARHALRHMLEHAGFTVILAAGGRQALRTFQERPIAAVVTDIMMPSMDGLRLIRELLTLQPSAVIIAISGAEKRLEVARQVGAKAVLRKPIELAELVRAVRLMTGQTVAAAEPVAG
jgi:CheY-like chemotaxis protein